jgi:Carboxypeptidase regulatory-like domain
MRGIAVCGALLVAFLAALGLGFSEDQAGASAAAAPTPGAPAQTVTLSGHVRDQAGPVAGALVRVEATENKTTTSANGLFTLRNVDSWAPITVTAWITGYYVGWAALKPNGPEISAGAPVSITMKRHYTGDNAQYDWFSFNGVQGSASCGLCHPQNVEWQADAHSQSAVNPRFLSMYSGTNLNGQHGQQTKFNAAGVPLPPDPGQPYYGPGWQLDFPGRAGNCAACHTPLASKIPNTANCGWSGCHTDVTSGFSNGVVPPGPSPLNLTGNAAEGITCDFCHKIGDVYLDPKTKLPLPDLPGILGYRLYRPTGGDQLFFGTFDDIPRRDTYLPLQKESAFCAPCHYGVFGGVVGVGSVANGTVIYNSYGEWLKSPYSDPRTGRTCQDCHMPPATYDHIVFPGQGGVKRDPNQIHDHRMLGVGDARLMQNAVTLTTTAQREGGQVVVDVSVTNDKTGHDVPSDAPLRAMILLVQAVDAVGHPLALTGGPVLPAWTGDLAGLSGRTYAKILRDDWTGDEPAAAYWRPVTIVADTRLAPFAADRSRYTFALPAGDGTASIQAQLLYRRAPQELMAQKGWTDADFLMAHDSVALQIASTGLER